jgi:hypothetical protein
MHKIMMKGFTHGDEYGDFLVNVWIIIMIADPAAIKIISKNIILCQLLINIKGILP